MQRYHVSEDGMARPCNAVGSCPLGEDTSHIESNSPAEVQAFAESVNEARFGSETLGGAKKSTSEATETQKKDLVNALQADGAMDDALFYMANDVVSKGTPELRSFLENAMYSYGDFSQTDNENRLSITAGEHAGFSNRADYNKQAKSYGELLSSRLTEWFGKPTTVTFSADELVED